MTEIRLENISKAYGSGQPAAVDGISLTVASGEFFFLLGPSGCGKTTLLRIVAGLLDATSGRVFFGTQDVTDLPAQRRQATMVFQNYALWPHMTVRQNVEFGPRMRGKDRKQRRELAETNLNRVRMAELAERKPSQLSGGQQQRVAVARALAAGGQALLLDEPLSNLDARLRAHMRLELRDMVKSSGKTALYVTHDQAEALSMADRIAVLNAGKIAQIGTPRELYEQPASVFVADFLGEANFVRGRVGNRGLTPISSAKSVSVPYFPDGVTQIQTDAGLLISASPADEGESVTCCVRPENILLQRVDQDVPAGMVSMPAIVTSRTYLGQMRQYLCRLGDGSQWKVSQLGGSELAFAPGQQVRLLAEPNKVVLLRE